MVHTKTGPVRLFSVLRLKKKGEEKKRPMMGENLE